MSRTGPGTREAQNQPQYSATLPANFTTPNFTLPAGVGELQWNPVDPNNPGTITLTVPTDNSGAAVTASNSYTLTLQTGIGAFKGQQGCLWFQTLGGSTFTIATTAPGTVTIYLAETTDVL